jgi:putative Mg2+ transporter-C (MgtC) family protein
MASVLRAVLAMVLCGAVGVEREASGKDAGVRTLMLVGLGSFLFTAISFYGIDSIQVTSAIEWDASRIAAQVVSGIGFIGAGVIFCHHDSVRGLTTAAAVWVAAAIGMACAADQIVLAVATDVLYFVAMFLVAPLAFKVLRENIKLLVTYEDGKGVLRDVLLALSSMGLVGNVVSSKQLKSERPKAVRVGIRLSRVRDSSKVLEAVAQIDGVMDVRLSE